MLTPYSWFSKEIIYPHLNKMMTCVIIFVVFVKLKQFEDS